MRRFHGQGEIKKEAVSENAASFPKCRFRFYFPDLIAACAAASLAIGTLKGEQLT
jgi:hypothetical protein